MRVTTGFGTVKVLMLKGEQGVQGEPFEFEDFTPEELAELRADVASVYYRKLEATYHTVGTDTTTIAIPFEDYSATDMLLVNVEGLLLAEGTDYTISNGSIVLTNPITHHYTAVNFLLLTAIALSVEDFNNLADEVASAIVASSTIESEVDAWLTAHPEATTTVQDNSITDAKLVQTGGVLEQVSDLKSNLSLLLHEGEIVGTPKNGYWRNGAFTEHESAYTKEFDVTGLHIVTLTEFANQYRDAYVFLDSSNNVLSSAIGEADHSASGHAMTLNVPSGAVYLDSSTSSTSNVPNISLTSASPNVDTGDIDNLQAQIDNLENLSYVVLNGNNANVFYRGTELKTGYSSPYSRKFKVVGGRKYRITLTTGANFNSYTFVDANGTILSYVLADSATSAEYYVTAPSGAEMLYCSTNSSTITSISVYQQVSEADFIDKVTRNKYLADILHDCICIGDSLTQGYRNETLHNIEDYSYPTFLSRMAGWEVVNAGWSGITPLGWWDKRTLYTYSNKQFAIIKLGQNGGLTDTLEEDTSASSYEDYANTNTGAYCKIIEYIKEQNPHIVIFVVSIRAYRDSVTNDVLQQIADKYNLPFIDLNDSRFNLEATDIHTISGVYDAVHFNTLGYSQLATSIYELIISNLANNKNLVVNYGEW